MKGSKRKKRSCASEPWWGSELGSSRINTHNVAYLDQNTRTNSKPNRHEKDYKSFLPPGFELGLPDPEPDDIPMYHCDSVASQRVR